MANTSITVGVLLIVLGLWGYFGTGTTSPTALIPAAFGILLVISGAIARNPEKRKLGMHIAVVVSLLGFLGSVRGLTKLGTLLAGGDVARPAAVIAQSIMAILTGVFTVLCVRSFIAARRTRA